MGEVTAVVVVAVFLFATWIFHVVMDERCQARLERERLIQGDPLYLEAVSELEMEFPK